VRAADTEGPPITCLLDTGSLHNRFGIWVAEVLGIDLDGAERGRLAVAGVTTTSLLVPLEPELEGFRWSAPVAFCDPWPFGFHLLGQEGFFRYFVVRFRASIPAFEVEPDEGDPEPFAAALA
jgi:hypothetical protein